MAVSLPLSAASRRRTRFDWRLGVALEVTVVLVVWQLMSGVWQLWDPDLIPAPTAILGALTHLAATSALAGNFAFSAINFAVGYVLAAVVGVIVGMALGSWHGFAEMAGPLFWTAYAVPRVALQPLLVLWLGFGSPPKILIIFLMAFFPIAINSMEGFATVPPSLLRASRVFGVNGWAMYRKVVLPASLPFVLAGLRLGISRGMVGVVVGEFIGGSEGLGFLIQRASSQFDLATALAVTALLVALANVGMLLLRLLRQRLAPWANDASGTII